MNFESILVVTYGRTGSTLLQGLLNAIPGVIVRGENYGFCSGLFHSYRALKKVVSEQGNEGGDATRPFFGSHLVSEDRFFSDVRTVFQHQLLPEGRRGVKCWGFKEIRYTPSALKIEGRYALHEYLDFLSLLMPKPAFVFLTRCHDDVTRSGFWQNTEAEHARSQITAFEEAARGWSNGKSNSFWIDYDDILTRSAKLREFYNFLDAAYDEKVISRVLSTKHSYGGKERTLKPAPVLNVEVGQSDLVAECILDHGVSQRILPNCETRLDGVVVLKPEIVQRYELVATDGQGVHAVTWHIASPKIAQQHPDNANAQSSRFMVEGLRATAENPIQIFLEDNLGQRDCLISISFSEGVQS